MYFYGLVHVRSLILDLFSTLIKVTSPLFHNNELVVLLMVLGDLIYPTRFRGGAVGKSGQPRGWP